MTLRGLMLRNLVYHWRGNLSVLFGVALGTAVLAGALLVGDSLRGSLRDQALGRLGWVHQALVSPRFIRAEHAHRLGVERACAAILLRGASSTRDQGGRPIRRAGQVTILGVTREFWPQGTALPRDNVWESDERVAVINETLAETLAVGVGDRINLSYQRAGGIPRETLLGRRDVSDVQSEVEVEVRAVLPDAGSGGFALHASPGRPANVFVPLSLLQRLLDQPGRCNAILTGPAESANLQARLGELLGLEDWGLELHHPESRTQKLLKKLDRNGDGRLTRFEWQRRAAGSLARKADVNRDGILSRAEILAYYRSAQGYLSLESIRMILDPPTVEAAMAAAGESGLTAAPTIVYLANSISDGARTIPYSIVAAVQPNLSSPLGPFQPGPSAPLRDDEIVLADWPDSPLHAASGSDIQLTYFLPETEKGFKERTATFKLRGVVPLTGVAADPDLTPEFPGITDKLDIREWDPPFPYDNKRIRKPDETFWEEFRTTPKAYITLSRGRQLWQSRFGVVTSVRLATARTLPGTEGELEKSASVFAQRLLARLEPASHGLAFEPVREQALQGSIGATDFGQLYLGFSCFLIIAALLLVGLLVRLNLDRRAAEMGLFMATGFTSGQVRLLLVAEGTVLALAGGMVGLGAAIGYAWLMLDRLRTWWPGRLESSLLQLHPFEQGGVSYLIGYVVACLVSILTIICTVRVLRHIPPRGLLAGETTSENVAGARRSGLAAWWIAGIALAAGIVSLVLGARMQGHEARAGAFFGGGALFLTSGLAVLQAWMRGNWHKTMAGQGIMAQARLAARNATRHPLRSMLTAGLLAAATFLIVAVRSFYRDAESDFLETTGGSGGFTLLAETNTPFYQDLNTERGLEELHVREADQKAMREFESFAFRVRAGDDASCLNLYRPLRPRILGVPQGIVDRGGFHFKAMAPAPLSAGSKANPWLLLDEELPGGAIPVFGEANTVQWILHSGLGRDILVPDENGIPVRLQFVGLLQDSVFQGELLMSEKNFLRLYPRQEGYQFLVIKAPPDQLDEARRLYESALAGYGVAVTRSLDRLQSYLAVENTYLATFQALGGLGLLLGALGLAVVLVRSAWERRAEIGLLRAIGFRQGSIGWLLLAENAFLLVLGLAVGTVAALCAAVPQFKETRSAVPWFQLAGLLTAVMASGLVFGSMAVRSTMRVPVLTALRRE